MNGSEVERGVATRVAAAQLGVPPSWLNAVVYQNRLVPPPPKDNRGCYEWRPEDIERARKVMAIDRRRKEHRGQRSA